MAGEKESKQEPMDGKQLENSEDLNASMSVNLNASNPALYSAPGQKFEPSLQSQTIAASIDKYLHESTVAQKLIEATDKLLRPSAAAQAVFDATQKMLRPSREIQALLEATDRALQPSREILAAITATEKMLKPSREIQVVIDATEKLLQPSREMHALALWTEKLIQPFTQQHAASFEAIDKIMQQSDSLKAMIAVMDTHRSTASLTSILGSFETLKASSFFTLLTSTDPTKLQSLIETYEGEQSFSDLTEAPPISKDVEAEIVQALKESSSPQKLTAPAMAFLILFIAAVHTFYEDISKWNDFRESVCDLQQRLGAFDSLAQARKLVRSALCDVPAALTDNFRLTKKEGVNLREGPGMKAEVIMTLPKFAPLELIDSTNRDWLLVTYKHEGLEIEGWVSRKYVRSASK
ncbi:MAG: SH3 domain-containing protein [Pseudomonas mandelii]